MKPAEIRTTSKISVTPHLKPQKSSPGIFTYLLSFLLLVIVAAAGYVFLLNGSDKPENVVTPKQSALGNETSKPSEITDQEKAKIEADAKKQKNVLNRPRLLKQKRSC